jgi:hypothetical protein
MFEAAGNGQAAFRALLSHWNEGISEIFWKVRLSDDAVTAPSGNTDAALEPGRRLPPLSSHGRRSTQI